MSIIRKGIGFVPPKPKCLDMELAVCALICHRRNLIIPNMYWSMFEYELDLLVVTKQGLAWEVEIKVSKQDLINDKEKRHTHNSSKIAKFYFAVPTELLKEIEHIPEGAGIIEVFHYNKGFKARIHRHAKVKSDYRFTEKEKSELYRLGAMRLWTVKRQLRKLQMAESPALKEER